MSKTGKRARASGELSFVTLLLWVAALLLFGIWVLATLPGLSPSTDADLKAVEGVQSELRLLREATASKLESISAALSEPCKGVAPSPKAEPTSPSARRIPK